MKNTKALITLIFCGMAMAPAVQAEDATMHYLYLTVAQDSAGSYATMSSNAMNLGPVDCPPALSVCDTPPLIQVEGVAYYADRPAAYQVTKVMEVAGSDARLALTSPIGVDDIRPGIGPIGPVDPRKDLLDVLEGLLGEDGIVTEEYDGVYHLLIQISYDSGERAITIASNVLDTSCDALDRYRLDNSAPWCEENVLDVEIDDPPEGVTYYTDKTDAYRVTDVMESASSDRRTAVTVPMLGDDILPGIGPIGPVDPRRIVLDLIGEINSVICSQLECQGQPIEP